LRRRRLSLAEGNSSLDEVTVETIRTKNLSTQAANQIREAIASGQFQPGTQLVEVELARNLGLSRSPIREALYLLEQEGLIVRYPRRGAFVRGLSRRETDEIFSLRTVLEGFAVERAVKNMSSERADKLRAMIREMYVIAKKQDAVLFGQIDAQFHEYLCEIAEHRVLQQVFNMLHSRIALYMTETSQLGDLADIAREHEVLLQHVLSGDVVEAVDAVRDHVLTSANRLSQSFPESSVVDPKLD
jgi:DNA-binding GntR family transcriptional regulator